MRKRRYNTDERNKGLYPTIYAVKGNNCLKTYKYTRNVNNRDKRSWKRKDESYPHYSMDYIVDLTPKIKLEIICSDSDAKKVINVIKESAHTGRGDGKIFISNIEEVISIRTGKAGDEAI